MYMETSAMYIAVEALVRFGTIPFLSHCRRCVFPVKRKVFANEDSQADGA